MFRSTKTFFGYKNLAASITALLVIAAGAYFGFLHPIAHAQQAGISGTGWSSTIGWIDIGSNGYNPGVTVNNGVISGAGWNNHIGWVSFNSNGCGPQGQVNASGQVSGWAQVLSTGGCIDLGSTNHGDGLTFSNGTLSGNAWGGNIVGWVQFSGTASCTPNYTCSNSSTSVYTNSQCQQSSTSCPGGCNAQTGQCNSCTPNYTCSGNSSVYTNAQCQKTTTSCPGNGSCSAQTGQCICTPGYVCLDANTSAYVNNQCGQSQITRCQLGCNAQTGQCNPQQIGPLQNSCLSAGTQWPVCTANARVDAGNTETLYWHTALQNKITCSLVGTNGDSWSPSTANGSVTTSALFTANNNPVTYTMHCSDGVGYHFDATVLITAVPKVIEK